MRAMPWPETSVVKQRHEFVLRALEPGANISDLAREHGISRKTAYKWLERFRERGVLGLEDLSRRPHCSPLRASGEAVLEVLRIRSEHSTWGPKKLHAVLARSKKGDELPSVRTIQRILERAGEVTRRRRPAPQGRPVTAPESDVKGPGDLWTVDFKGWWNADDGARCEPLTVRDAHSRFVLCAQLVHDTCSEAVKAEFEQLFKEHGLPRAIQVDNGPPFACTRAVCGLTKLSAWWVALGIRVIRGRPAHPQDNGAHERMHLDMRYEVEDVGADSIAVQQERLDTWRQEFNHVRPHEALSQQTPASVYHVSPRPYKGPRDACYPPHAIVRVVNSSGRIRYRGHLVRVGTGLRGYEVGVLEIDDTAVRIQFYELDLGLFTLAA